MKLAISNSRESRTSAVTSFSARSPCSRATSGINYSMLIQGADIRIDATILEKSKALPHTRPSDAHFYMHAWYYHFRSVGPAVIRSEDELLLTAAALGRKRDRERFETNVNAVVGQVTTRNSWGTYFCPAMADPCLQVADYCAWAIQRKWERNDLRSYQLIQNKVVREYDLWGASAQHHY